MEVDADGFVKRPRSWKPWLAALVIVVAIGLAARALFLSDARAETGKARADYMHKESVHRLHVQIARELIIRGVRKANTKPKGRDDDYEAYSAAADAEKAFMEACRRCASASECERDRLVIVSGRASDVYNPCD